MTLGEVGVVVAARTLSSRLPGKALLPLQGMPMVLFLLRRLSRLRSGAIVLATTGLASDDRLAELVQAAGYPVFRGADADVMARYVATAEKFGFDTVVRVTADCPFVDADLVDWCLAQAESFDRFDLVSTKGRFPVGLDVEIYRAAIMSDLHRSVKLSADDREHLTLYLYHHNDRFTVRAIEPRAEWRGADCRFTVDTQDDYAAASALAAMFDAPEFAIAALLARAAA